MPHTLASEERAIHTELAVFWWPHSALLCGCTMVKQSFLGGHFVCSDLFVPLPTPRLPPPHPPPHPPAHSHPPAPPQQNAAVSIFVGHFGHV